jgi:hypothetical protein
VVEAGSGRVEEAYMVVVLGACMVGGWRGAEASPDMEEGAARSSING